MSQEPAPILIARSILGLPGLHSWSPSGQSFHGLRFSIPNNKTNKQYPKENPYMISSHL